MHIWIYQSLIISTVFVLHDANVLSVEMKNVSGLLGENGTEIECSYTKENVLRIISVRIYAFNRISMIFEEIAVYIPEFLSSLTTEGQYLKGRVTVMNITQSSTKALMIFNKLMCIDDTFYRCTVKYTNLSLKDNEKSSNNMSIRVQVSPTKPDRLSWMKVYVDSLSTTPTVPMPSTTSSSSTDVTTKLNETISTLVSDEQNDKSAAPHSSSSTTDHYATSSTPFTGELSTNSSYITTTYSIPKTTTAPVIAEGDNITVFCAGDVGKPPAKHIIEKYIDGKKVPMENMAIITSISDLSENCTYYRTSNLTFQMTADDNNAVIRCVVNSSIAEPDMFVETAPIEVYFEVSMPTITKNPKKTYYVVGEDTSIHLTCKSNGNPKPNYQWYKENNNELISTSANWTITDINVTNSGVYTCNVSNTFNGDTHRNVKQVQINIMNKDDIPTTQSSSTCSTSCVGKKEETSTEKLDDIPTTQSSSNCRSACVDKKEENSKGNLVLVAGIVGAVVAVVIVIIVIIACTCRRRKNKSPAFTNVSNSFGDSKPKPVTELRTGDYDYIALEDDPPKTKSSNDGLEVEDINKHNEEYLKKQEEEEKKKNESKTPPQPAVYAQVNEATKSKNKLKTETQETANKQEEDTYAESQEGIYDKAGDRRHIENENVEHFDSSMNSSKQNSNGDNKLSIQTSQVGSYANQGFEKDENRKVATVSPTVRSSTGSQNDEQTNSNRNSQSKKGYENIIGTDQTGISVEESSHRTAL